MLNSPSPDVKFHIHAIWFVPQMTVLKSVSNITQVTQREGEGGGQREREGDQRAGVPYFKKG